MGLMDRRLCYEVTGIKLDGDDFASDSADSVDSASSSSDGDGDSLLLRSPPGTQALSSGGAGATSKKSNQNKKGKLDLQAIDEILTALVQDDNTSQKEPKTLEQKVGVPTSNSINN